MSRNSSRAIKNVKQSDFETLFKNRNTTNANIYLDSFISYPNDEIRRKLSYEEHYWSSGDRYYKLSYKYYGNKEDWWVIARFNGKPTEADLVIGERLIIPKPIELVKDYMGYYNG